VQVHCVVHVHDFTTDDSRVPILYLYVRATVRADASRGERITFQMLSKRKIDVNPLSRR
jgi:hypothetical protein